jgi:hypothetical protein
MAIIRPVKRNKVDAFLDGAPDAHAETKLRGRKKPITLTLPPEVIDRFDAAAAQEHRSRASMLEVVMREWLDRRAV